MKMFLYLPSTEDQKTSGVNPQGGDHPPHTNMAQQTPTGHSNSKWVEAEHNLQTSPGRRLIHFSQTSSNVTRNWCRPVTSPSPSWRR